MLQYVERDPGSETVSANIFSVVGWKAVLFPAWFHTTNLAI